MPLQAAHKWPHREAERCGPVLALAAVPVNHLVLDLVKVTRDLPTGGTLAMSAKWSYRKRLLGHLLRETADPAVVQVVGGVAQKRQQQSGR